MITEFGEIARRQLVCALQVHVSAGDADRALAVYNAARAFLPLLAALAVNAPFYEGRDTGLASVRPKIGQLLPRKGIPPAIASWMRTPRLFVSALRRARSRVRRRGGGSSGSISDRFLEEPFWDG